MPTVKYGFQGKLYLNSGSYGSPTWVEVANTRDVKVVAEYGETEASTRAGGGLEQAEPVLQKLGLDGLVRTDQSDTGGFVAMETAFLGRAVLDVLVLDGGQAVNGSRGYRYDAKLFKFGEDQTLDRVLFREFSLKPCVSTNPAQKAVVATGAPVFTSLAA